MNNTRRGFLKNGIMVSIGFIGLNNFAVTGAVNAFSQDVLGFGPLMDGDNDILSLPKGFRAKIISSKGDIMSDGLFTPGAYDGMGAFKWNKGKVILIRNHELNPGENALGPYGENKELLAKIDRSKIYDFGKDKNTCMGGTTTLLYDEKSGKVDLQYLSLAGTVRNCAGGITPWNSWITCEETELKKSAERGTLEQDHGYNFEVKASEKIGLADPIPLKEMGRFIHEAVAVHPGQEIVYQTEDSGDGLFYRFLLNEKGNLQKGGKLQCLSIREWKSADTRNWESLGSEFPQKKQFDVEWIDLDNVEAPDNDLRLRGYTKGAARFARGEGIWYGKDELYFACTNGGKKSQGQIFRYTPSKMEGKGEERDSPGKIELFLEPNNIDIFTKCDNLTIAPWGDVIICEDKKDARIIGITPQGQTYVIAKNIGYRESEFAGPVFSPSGKTLFVNIQTPGVTLAITGPWNKKVKGKK